MTSNVQCARCGDSTQPICIECGGTIYDESTGCDHSGPKSEFCRDCHQLMASGPPPQEGLPSTDTEEPLADSGGQEDDSTPDDEATDPNVATDEEATITGVPGDSDSGDSDSTNGDSTEDATE